jgi:hypothetical protein
LELYIGLEFYSESIHSKKINSFRSRFDSKFSFDPDLKLTLVPPFEIEFSNKQSFFEFKESIDDLVETHFMDSHKNIQIEFNGIDLKDSKSKTLGLKPKESVELQFFIEDLYEFLKSEGAVFKKSKSKIDDLILPISRTVDDLYFESVIDLAKIEFSTPFVLNSKSISLWKRENYLWSKHMEIHYFKEDKSLNFVNTLW